MVEAVICIDLCSLWCLAVLHDEGRLVALLLDYESLRVFFFFFCSSFICHLHVHLILFSLNNSPVLDLF